MRSTTHKVKPDGCLLALQEFNCRLHKSEKAKLTLFENLKNTFFFQRGKTYGWLAF